MRGENKKPRAVIDTNLVVNGMISSTGIGRRVFAAFYTAAFRWVLTEETFAEIVAVLNRDNIRERYHLTDAQIGTFANLLKTAGAFVEPLPLEHLPIHSRDPKDDPLLSCALGGHCEYLVTEDKDLLILKGRPELRKLTITPAYNFLKWIE